MFNERRRVGRGTAAIRTYLGNGQNAGPGVIKGRRHSQTPGFVLQTGIATKAIE